MFYNNFTIFTILKKLITILFILIAATSFAQTKGSVDNDSKLVKYYPNPASSAINFELPRGYDKSYSIQIYNFMGKKISEFSVSSQRMYFSLDGFYRGVYIYQLRDRYGKVIDSGKFQVIR